MRARFKGPSGTGTIELADDATVQAVFDDIKAKASINHFTIKYGPPMAMKTLDISSRDQPAKSLGLHGETLTIVPDEPRSASSTFSPAGGTATTVPARKPPRPSGARSGDIAGEISVPWPELLRVMPSDNSCLFTAFGGALPQQIPAQQLRRMMANYISEHPEVYSEAVLGCSPAEYRRTIQDPDRWGGGIELSILSSIFDIQICTYDVQSTFQLTLSKTQNLINFGEMKRDRCVLVYSGIHYDRIAFSYSDFPHDGTSLPPDMDRTLWPTDDAEILHRTQKLVEKLHAAHYYTDTEGLILKCDAPGCDWIGSGQLEGRKHAELTGHIELSEITDSEADSVLRRCDAPRCYFIGQGDRAVRRHRDDTGHERYSVIPDC
ncbi:Putative ubiquitin thioesterase otu1 [Tolypocladium paradoxum]|uniref:Ubiquitin thioesterase OTU n=1 Tax=Tolypocladium paradoxum TaxID=94208 RepID=A0A2S4KZ64_9HYPO|nr:Putative ubiquitin thioesterase otu1 [Tolypocladium paradoxum]